MVWWVDDLLVPVGVVYVEVEVVQLWCCCVVDVGYFEGVFE